MVIFVLPPSTDPKKAPAVFTVSVAILGSYGIMLTTARPEAHNGWVTLLDGGNGFVPDPLAIDPRKRRPPTGVTMDGTSALTGSVKRLQLGVFHVPVCGRSSS